MKKFYVVNLSQLAARTFFVTNIVPAVDAKGGQPAQPARRVGAEKITLGPGQGRNVTMSEKQADKLKNWEWIDIGPAREGADDAATITERAARIREGEEGTPAVRRPTAAQRRTEKAGGEGGTQTESPTEG
jgi:hypothetical protein